MLELFVDSNVFITDNREEAYCAVSMADDACEPQHYIIFQRNFEIDKQDIEIGLVDYYFEVNSPRFAGYNVCKQVLLNRDKLVIDILEENVRLHSYIDKIIINFSIPKSDYLNLVKAMRYLFINTITILLID